MLQRFKGHPFGALLVAGLLATATAAAGEPIPSCVNATALPCAATSGETYGTVVLPNGNDAPDTVLIVLRHVLGADAGAGLLVRDLYRDGGGFDFTPDTINRGRTFQWLHQGQQGSSESPAYLTVKAGQGFILFAVFGAGGGSVDISGAPGGHEVSHASFWRSLSSSCVPVRAEKVHGKGLQPNARLALIEDGSVPCVHVDTGERAECVFTKKSGSWVKSPQGNYAQTGQMLTLQGQPGGEYVVAAQVGSAGAVACLEPSGRDTAGTASGTELAGTCMVETMLSPSNASGLRLRNHATLEVCTSSNPHPDGAPFTRMLNEKSYCYIGEGAALNDINGTERDPWGVYYPTSRDCHVVWSNGVETPGAKRPATISFPHPVRINPNSPVVWRPVDQRVDIANKQP